MRAAIFVLLAVLAFPSASARADDDPAKGWVFTGVTQATSADVLARVTGYVTQVAVKEGDKVAEGDFLIEIDQRLYRLDLDAANARVRVAEAKIEAAKISAANAKKLLEKKVISQEEFSLKMAMEAEEKAALMVAMVERERAELILSWTRVTAPFAGNVSRIRVVVGGLVTADQTQILTVVSTDSLHIAFNVPEAILLQLRQDRLTAPESLGVSVGFAGEEGYPHEAKLDLIELNVDSRTGSVRFQATMPNPKGIFLPGMSARVRLTPAPK